MKRPITPATRWLLASCFFVLTYFVLTLVKLPVLRYLPQSGVWTFSPPAGIPSIGYYGKLLYAAAAAGLGALIGGIGPLSRRPLANLLPYLAGIVISSSFVVLCAYELVRWGSK